jgi:hypothetical protein
VPVVLANLAILLRRRRQMASVAVPAAPWLQDRRSAPCLAIAAAAALRAAALPVAVGDLSRARCRPDLPRRRMRVCSTAPSGVAIYACSAADGGLDVRLFTDAASYVGGAGV